MGRRIKYENLSTTLKEAPEILLDNGYIDSDTAAELQTVIANNNRFEATEFFKNIGIENPDWLDDMPLGLKMEDIPVHIKVEETTIDKNDQAEEACKSIW